MKVCIDAGHGGSDPGAIGKSSKEKCLNLAIAQYLEYELELLGFLTYMTRRTDRSLGLKARADFANRYNVDLFVSIHCNAANAKSAEGIEVWTFPHSATSRPYALSVQDHLINDFPSHEDRGVREANYTVLRETNMAAILVECEFMSNAKQERFLKKEKNQKALAKSIAAGIEYAGGLV